MKPKRNPFALHTLALFVALPCFFVSVHGAQSGKTKPAPVSDPKPPAPQEIPKSVFIIPASPKEGRNPFFPNAAQPAPLPDPGQHNKVGVPISAFVLNGITSPPKRTAIINFRTFEPGESGEVKLNGGGKVMIKCEEIRDDSAIITVDGKRVELRLRLGL